MGFAAGTIVVLDIVGDFKRPWFSPSLKLHLNYGMASNLFNQPFAHRSSDVNRSVVGRPWLNG